MARDWLRIMPRDQRREAVLLDEVVLLVDVSFLKARRDVHLCSPLLELISCSRTPQSVTSLLKAVVGVELDSLLTLVLVARTTSGIASA